MRIRLCLLGIYRLSTNSRPLFGALCLQCRYKYQLTGNYVAPVFLAFARECDEEKEALTDLAEDPEYPPLPPELEKLWDEIYDYYSKECS